MDTDSLNWYALKTSSLNRTEDFLRPLCSDIYVPLAATKHPSGKSILRPLIPKVMFVETSQKQVETFERLAKEKLSPEWLKILRMPAFDIIEPIPAKQMHLFRLLTADDGTRCQVFNKTTLSHGSRVRVTGGVFEGYEGYVQRIERNRHVVVKIDGICCIALPFIHPELLMTI